MAVSSLRDWIYKKRSKRIKQVERCFDETYGLNEKKCVDILGLL